MKTKLLFIIIVISLLVLTGCSSKKKTESVEYSTLLLKVVDEERSQVRDPYYIDAYVCIFQDTKTERIKIWCGDIKKDSWEEIKVMSGIQDKEDPNKWYNTVNVVGNKKGEYYVTRAVLTPNSFIANQSSEFILPLSKIMDIDLKVEGKLTDGISNLNLTIYNSSYGSYRSVSACFKRSNGVTYVKTSYNSVECNEGFFNYSSVTVDEKGKTNYSWYSANIYRCGSSMDNLLNCDSIKDNICFVQSLPKPDRYLDYDFCVRFEKTLNKDNPSIMIEIESRTFLPHEDDHIELVVFDKDRDLDTYETTGFFPSYSNSNNEDVGAIDSVFKIEYQNS